MDVLWLAHSELAFYGLPALLGQVPEVSGHVVCQDSAAVEQHLADGFFDVCVLPLSVYGPALGRLARTGAGRLVLSLSDTAVLHPGLAHGRRVDAWLLEQCITLDVLRETFRQLALPVTGAAAPLRTEPTADAAGRSGRRNGRLTARELSVLRLLVQGLTNQQIARALGISVHGVKRHLSNLMLKFDCSNRTEVALAALRIWG
ncbi:MULTISPECIES: response regulator transcription factor [unclassified Streptomyces]|uniref:helix-turn-helix transcriptional regulator n=1 Tax=unclassified Streptomyces TaxID=2593676 RepID=UPI003700BFBE